MSVDRRLGFRICRSEAMIEDRRLTTKEERKWRAEFKALGREAVRARSPAFQPHVLADVMGFHSAGNEGNRFRYRASTGDEGAHIVDLLCVPDAPRGAMGAGNVHHIAFPNA